MTVQAQDAQTRYLVDEDDPNADAQNIADGLSMVDADGDTLMIRGGTYGEAMAINDASTGAGGFTNKNIVVRIIQDDDGQRMEVNVTEFAVNNGFDVTLVGDGDGFLDVTTDGNRGSQELGLRNGSVSIQTASVLQVDSNADVFRTANASVSGNEVQYPSGADVFVTYNVNNGGFDAGLEIPADLGTGRATVSGSQTGTVTFPSGRFGSFSTQMLRLQGAGSNATFEGDVTATNASVANSANQTLTVDGMLDVNDLQYGTSNNATVDVGGDFLADSDLTIGSGGGAGQSLLVGGAFDAPSLTYGTGSNAAVHVTAGFSVDNDITIGGGTDDSLSVGGNATAANLNYGTSSGAVVDVGGDFTANTASPVGNGSGQVLSVGGSLDVNTLSYGGSDAAVDVTNAAMVINGFGVGADQNLSVGGTLHIEGANETLAVNSNTANGDSVTVGALEYETLSQNNTGATATLRGGGRFVSMGDVTFQADDTGGGTDYVQEVRPSMGGDFDINGDVVETTAAGSNDETVVDLVTDGNGMIAVGGGTGRMIVQNAGGQVTFMGDFQIDSQIDNSGNGATITVEGDATLTAVNNSGAPINHNNSDTGGINGDGTLRFEGGNIHNFAVTSNTGDPDVNRFPNVVVATSNRVIVNGDDAAIRDDLTVESGTADLRGVAGTTTATNVEIANGGILNINGTALSMMGDFMRAPSNAQLLTNNSTMAFTGSNDAVFDVGTLLTIEDSVAVDKPGATLTLMEAVRVQGDFHIVDQGQNPRTTLAMEDNLFLQNGGGQLTIDGNLENSQFAIVFEEAGYTVAGDDTLGTSIVDIGGAAGDVNVTPSASPNTNATTMIFDESIDLRNGGLAIAGGEDLSPADLENGFPAVIRALDGGDGQQITGAGTFNNENNLYDLTYAATDDGPSTDQTTSELTNFVANLTVEDDVSALVDRDSTTINAQLKVEGDENSSGSNPPAQRIGGRLDDNGSGAVLELAAADTNHEIYGQVSGASSGDVELMVTGSGATLEGRDDEDASFVEDLKIAAEDVTSTTLQQVDGDVTVTNGADFTFGLSNADNSGINGDGDDDQTVEGVVTVNDSMALASNVELVSGANPTVSVSSTGTNGTVNLNTYNMVLTGDGAGFTGDTDATYLSDQGYLVFNNQTSATPTNQTLGTDTVAVPRVMVASPINLSSSTATTVRLDANSSIALNGNLFESSGAAELSANVTGTASGSLFRATDSTVTVQGGNRSISNFEVATDAGTVYLRSDASDPFTNFLVVSNRFTLASGTFDHATNMVVTGDLGTNDEFIYESGSINATAGYVVLNNDNLSFDLTEELTVPKLGVVEPADLDDEQDLRVTTDIILRDRFLSDVSDSDGRLRIDGATVIRPGNAPNYTGQDVLDEAPAVDQRYNLVYGNGQGQGANFTSGFEADSDSISTLTVNIASGGSVHLDVDQARLTSDVDVNSRLNLNAGTLTYGRQVVIAQNGTVRRTANARIGSGSPDIDPDGYYTLRYVAGSDLRAFREEFVDSPTAPALIAQGSGTVSVGLDRNADSLNATTDVQVDSTGTLTLQNDSRVTGASLTTADSGTLDADGRLLADNSILDGQFNFSDDLTVTNGGDAFTEGNQQNNEVVFDGGSTQEVSLLTTAWVNTLELDQNGGQFASRVDVEGGDIDLTGELRLYGGLLDVRQDDDNPTTSNVVILSTVNNFDRTVDTGESSHVVGQVRMPNIGTDSTDTGSFQYPVGTDTSSVQDEPNARYRPYTLVFDQDPALQQTAIDVHHIAENPMGTAGFPLKPDSVRISNYPDYFWLVTSDGNLGPDQNFNIEMRGDDVGLPEFDDVDNLRVIRRFDGDFENNNWRVQGGTHDNFLQIDGPDSTVVVQTIDAQGGLSTQGASRFTMGIPSRAPIFTTAPAPGDTLTVQEDSSLTVNFEAEGQDFDSELSFSISDTPQNSSFTQQTDTTAQLAFTPDFDQQGFYSPQVKVTDTNNGLADSLEFTIEVQDNQPQFVLGDPTDNGVCGPSDAGLVLRWTVDDTTLTRAQRLASDVGGTAGQIDVNAGDASVILQYAVQSLSTFPDFPEGPTECVPPGGGSAASKAQIAGDMSNPSGKLSWGELQDTEQGDMVLPLKLEGDVQNVRAVQFTANFDPAKVNVKGVRAPNLPNGWQLIHRVNDKDGTVKISMAGVQSASPGTLANLTLKLEGDDASTTFDGNAVLNMGTNRQIEPKSVSSIPGSFALKANRPNPVRNRTTIEYSLPKETDVRLEVYNVLGQRVATLVDEQKSAGTYQVNLDASDLASGVYIYRIEAGSFSETSRMTVVR